MYLIFEIIGKGKLHIDALFDLLCRRTHSISHHKIPTYDEHEKFVINNPYRVWYLVKDDDGYIGSVYITNQNTIGINIVDSKLEESIPLIIGKIKSQLIPLPAIKSVRTDCFSINVSPHNNNIKLALERFGCRIVQVSYLI